jgi:hypothetical protein
LFDLHRVPAKQGSPATEGKQRHPTDASPGVRPKGASCRSRKTPLKRNAQKYRPRKFSGPKISGPEKIFIGIGIPACQGRKASRSPPTHLECARMARRNVGTQDGPESGIRKTAFRQNARSGNPVLRQGAVSAPHLECARRARWRFGFRGLGEPNLLGSEAEKSPPPKKVGPRGPEKPPRQRGTSACSAVLRDHRPITRIGINTPAIYRCADASPRGAGSQAGIR